MITPRTSEQSMTPQVFYEAVTDRAHGHTVLSHPHAWTWAARDSTPIFMTQPGGVDPERQEGSNAPISAPCLQSPGGIASMKTPPRWYAVVRPAAASGAPAAFVRHLGLGAEFWPFSPGDEPLRRALDRALDFHPVPTLDGVEWVPLLTDLEVALALHAHASKTVNGVVVLNFGLDEGSGSLGWDLGRPSGGHSVIPHELGLPPFKAQASHWLNDSGLFATRDAALAFWDTRQRVSEQHPDWEEPSGWAIVHVGLTAGARVRIGFVEPNDVHIPLENSPD